MPNEIKTPWICGHQCCHTHGVTLLCCHVARCVHILVRRISFGHASGGHATSQGQSIRQIQPLRIHAGQHFSHPSVFPELKKCCDFCTPPISCKQPLRARSLTLAPMTRDLRVAEVGHVKRLCKDHSHSCPVVALGLKKAKRRNIGQLACLYGADIYAAAASCKAMQYCRAPLMSQTPRRGLQQA